MYSGITQGLFVVSRVEKKPGIIHYAVVLNEHLMDGLKIGSSVNVDGVCQTVAAINALEVQFTAIDETLRCTTLNELFVGRLVSIERSIHYGDEIGGQKSPVILLALQKFCKSIGMKIICDSLCAVQVNG